MSERRIQFTKGLLLGAHVLAGGVMGAIGYQFDGWTEWQSLGFVGLLGSEMLLLGIWVGFSSVSWWLRLAGLLAGIGWLTVLTILPDPEYTPRWDFLIFVSVPVTVVAVGGGCWRLFVARLERRDTWAPKTVSEDLQFSLKTLGLLTIALSLILALGRLFRWLSADGQFLIFILIIAFVGLLAVASTVWSCLGNGQALVRVPLMLVIMAMLGLLVPYYAQMEQQYYFMWPVMLVVIAAYTGGSLLVVRSSGYRLIWCKSAAVDQPLADQAQGTEGPEPSRSTESAPV